LQFFAKNFCQPKERAQPNVGCPLFQAGNGGLLGMQFFGNLLLGHARLFAGVPNQCTNFKLSVALLVILGKFGIPPLSGSHILFQVAHRQFAFRSK